LGWLQAHANIIKRIIGAGVLDSGGGMNPFTSAIIRGAIEAGELEQHIGGLRLRYRKQLSAMVEALRLHLPEVVYQIPKGGYFIWLRLPEHINAGELRQQAKSFKVGFRQGALFSSTNEAQSCIRLCFARYDEAQIKQGVLRLQECLNA
jgi:2-aminoadipate transaminase